MYLKLYRLKVRERKIGRTIEKPSAFVPPASRTNRQSNSSHPPINEFETDVGAEISSKDAFY